jgi:hypothetical protein
MLGHEVTLSETNARGWVPLCACGWVGNVVPAFYVKDPRTGRARRNVERTQSLAFAAHERHVHDVREETAREHALALDRHAKLIATATPTLRRAGRWGNG